MNSSSCRDYTHVHHGYDVVYDALRGIYADMDFCRRIAEKKTEGKAREELVDLIAGVLFGIASFRQTVVNTHLFGSPDARL